jgi:hypothetical protein
MCFIEPGSDYKQTKIFLKIKEGILKIVIYPSAFFFEKI